MENLFDYLLSSFGNFTEVEHWGWNAITLTAMATVVVTVIQGYGLLEQRKTIYREKKAESISLTYFSFFTFEFLAFAIYGMSEYSLAMIFDGLVLGFLRLPILVGIKKFRGFTIKEKILMFIFSLILPVMIMIPNKSFLMGILMVVGFYPSLMVPVQVWKIKNGNEVDSKFCWSIIVTCVFWGFYALAIGNLLLTGINFISIIIFALTLFLKKKFSINLKTQKS